jgi:hypothetical protein
MNENIILDVPHAETFKRKLREVTVDKKLIEEVLDCFGWLIDLANRDRESEAEQSTFDNLNELKSKLEKLLGNK